MADAKWTLQITPRQSLFSFPVREIWTYRDLLYLLVHRDFVALYKQTVLGPLWFLLQPLLMTLVFTVVFGRIAQLSTDELPQVLFYLAGITCWTYFSETLTKTSETFLLNAQLFGKVYFPRVIVPLSIVISNLLKFGIQLFLFLMFVGYYWSQGTDIVLRPAALLLPLLILLMGGLGLALGMIISALTTKYRDLRFLLTFAVQLLMFATPVIYPMSTIPSEYRSYIALNPVTPIIEAFRFGFLGRGDFDWLHLSYSFGVMILLLSFAFVIFNRIEKTFMDTV